MTDRPAVDIAALRTEHVSLDDGPGAESCRQCGHFWPCPTVVFDAAGVTLATSTLASLDAKVQREADDGR